MDIGGYQVIQEGHDREDTSGVTGTWGMFGALRTREEGGRGNTARVGRGWDTSPTGNARNAHDKAQGGSRPDTSAPPAPVRGSQGVPKEGRGCCTWQDPLGPSGPPPRGPRGEKGGGGRGKRGRKGAKRGGNGEKLGKNGAKQREWIRGRNGAKQRKNVGEGKWEKRGEE